MGKTACNDVNIKEAESDYTVNTYDIFDTLENEYITRNATAIEISEKYNISKQMVYQYQARGYLLEKRYLININKKVDESFKKQWDSARFKVNPYARRNNDHDK